MQCEFAVLVYNRMARICTALKTNHNVRFLRKHVRDFTFSFVAPVGANYCFNHSVTSLIILHAFQHAVFQLHK